MKVSKAFQPVRFDTIVAHGACVGVGSLVPISRDSERVYAILGAIKDERPDLRLHGFGLKVGALSHDGVRHLLESADSMAWSMAARQIGQQNNYDYAIEFAERISSFKTAQKRLFF